MNLGIFKVGGLKYFILSLILTILVLGLYFFQPNFLNIIELKTLDMKFLIRGSKQPGPEVVLAVIDEKSVDQIGRWPWPRSTMARVIRSLSQDGAKTIALDIGFFEPDRNTNLDLLDRLTRELASQGTIDRDLDEFLKLEKEQSDNDLILARTIQEIKKVSPVILGHFLHIRQDEDVAHMTPEQVQTKIDAIRDVPNSDYVFVLFPAEGIDLNKSYFLHAYVPEVNIDPLPTMASASGYFNMDPDSDGTVRRVPMTILVRDKFYMPLSLQALRFFLGDVPGGITVGEFGVEEVTLGDYSVPTDEKGLMLVNFRGPGKTFPHYSISDLLQGRLPQGTFKDKIVLIGPTAVGIYDLRVTPFSSIFPGVEVHANVIDNVLQQDFLVQPQWADTVDLILIVFIGFFLGLFMPRLSAFNQTIFTAGLVILWVAGNYYLFTQGTWLNIVYPLLTIILIFTGITIYRYMTEEREKKKIRGAFSYYVNPSVVSEMLKNPDKLKLGGEKRILTVLFSDIRGFTTISENLDPEALVNLLNQYLTVMTNLVFKFDGLVDKYIGDALMAVWGAPLSQPRHAILACKTSLEMMQELEKLRQKWVAEDPGVPFIDIGIGVNSGPMVVGNMGSELRFDYTVMGDAVNLGSRLEGANKQYGTNIIVGEITYEQVGDELYCRELDSVAVKGKTLPVKIFELIGEPGQVSEEKLNMLRAFTRGLTAYKLQQWDEAEKIFSAIKCYYPEDKPTELYLQRVEELKNSPPPPDWDGVYVMKTK